MIESLKNLHLFIGGRDRMDQLCQIRDGKLDSAKGKQSMGWLFPKESILKKPMDDLLLQVAQSGLGQKLQDKYWSIPGIGQEINCDIEYTPLELNIVWILFKALAIGSGLAFGILLSELFLVYISERPNCLFSGSAKPEPESELFDRIRTPNQNRTIYFYKSVQK